MVCTPGCTGADAAGAHVGAAAAGPAAARPAHATTAQTAISLRIRYLPEAFECGLLTLASSCEGLDYLSTNATRCQNLRWLTYPRSCRYPCSTPARPSRRC